MRGEFQLPRAASTSPDHAIGASVTAAIRLGVIVAAFGGVFLGLRVAGVLALLLVAAMLAMVAALGLFLAEVRLASAHLPLEHDVGPA